MEARECYLADAGIPRADRKQRLVYGGPEEHATGSFSTSPTAGARDVC